MQLVVNNLLTSYELQGKGRLVLLLHGWGDSKETFKDLSKHLAKRFKVVALDLPGFGQTQMPGEVWDLDNYGRFVADFLAKLKLSDPEIVIGHSNGGALAIRALSTGNLRASSLVLLASAGVRTGQTGKRLALKVIAKVGKVLTFWLPRRYRERLQKSLYGAAGSDMLVAPHLQETFKRTVRQDIQADAAGLRLPTLLIYAEDDRAVPIADGEKLALLIPNSQLVRLPDADHFVHHTAEKAVIEAIEGFVK